MANVITSPFYIIKIQGSELDLVPYIKSFRYEDLIEGDNHLEFALQGFQIEKYYEDGTLGEGKILEFKFGFYGGEQSAWHKAKIMDSDPNYSRSGFDLKIRATDLGAIMKQDPQTTIWRSKKASQIAQEIAKKYNLKTEIQETKKKYETIAQGNRSDWHFLEYLATQEPNLRFYVSGETLKFGELKLKDTSKLSLTWNDGKGSLVEFNPKIEQTDKRGGKQGVKIQGYDAQKKKIINQTITPEKNKNVLLGNLPYEKDFKSIGVVNMPVSDYERARNVASQTQTKNALDGITASCTLNPGSPSLQAEDVITINGVISKFSGNWFIKKITHQIDSSSGYVCNVDLSKNAVRGKGQNNNGPSQNNTQGPNNVQGNQSVKKRVVINVKS